MKYVLVLSTVLVFLSCKKEVTDLPAATQTGAQTFGARVNGNLWVPKGVGVIGKPMLEAHYDIGRSVIINARNFAAAPKESEFEIRLKNVVTPGEYLLNDNTGNSVYYVERKLMPTGEWKTDNQNSGKVVITVTDTVNRIISGTFEFKAGSLYNETPLEVRDGRFDIKIQ